MNNVENEGEIKFRVLLKQIELCLQQRLNYVAIIASLVIPDIGGAIDLDNGVATKPKYVTWFDKYVKPRYAGNLNLTGVQCYYLRCAILHQGKTKHDNDNIKVSFTDFPQVNSPVNPFTLHYHNDLGL